MHRFPHISRQVLLSCSDPFFRETSISTSKDFTFPRRPRAVDTKFAINFRTSKARAKNCERSCSMKREGEIKKDVFSKEALSFFLQKWYNPAELDTCYLSYENI